MSEVTEPSKETFYFPSFGVTSEFSAILGFWRYSVSFMGSDKSDVLFEKFSIKWIRIIGLVANNRLRFFSHQRVSKCLFDQRTFCG